MDDKTNPNRKSPLYTSKTEAERKAKLVRALGADTDGAYRAYGRIDRADVKSKGD